MDIKEKIDTLRRDLHRHNDLYYKENSPEISDYEFDQMMHELQDLELAHPEFFDENSPSVRVGSDINKAFSQVKHRYQMLSLGNTYTREEVADFIRRCESSLNEPVEICAELKYDGTSISLTYENGRLLRAVTRGDGVQGDDVTANARTIRTIPLVLQGEGYPSDFEMRGEVLLPWKEFERLNQEREDQEEPLFANPRNAASGTLKLQNSKIVASRKLEAILYYMLGAKLPTDSHFENMRIASSWGFNMGKNMKLCSSIDQVFEFINYWDVERKNLSVATDGIVLKVNSIRQQEELGYTAKNPRWAIAFKFQAERAESVLHEVTYQVGRTGIVTPVANLEPVQLSGTVVKRASLYNEDAINALDLHIGDICYVEKGGEIIPKIVGVDTEHRHNLGKKVEFIKICPECGTPLERLEGEAAYFCPNQDTCPPQIKGRIEHFIARKAMNVDGLGPETIDSFYASGLVGNASDLYYITKEQIMNCPRTKSEDEEESAISQADVNEDADFGGLFAQPVLKRKTSVKRFTALVAQKILDALEDSKSVPFERVLFALGIRFVGETVAKRIAFAFKNIDNIIDASLEELISIDDVGERIACSVRDYMNKPENLNIIARLRNAGLQMSVSEEKTLGATDKLQGRSFVISGTFSQHSRDEYKTMIEMNGGKNVGSISSKTDYILAGEKMGPAKLDKAQKLNIPIIDESQFLKMIE